MDSIPNYANLLPWLVGALVTMLTGMLIWIRTSVDSMLKELVKGQHQDREDRGELTASILVLSIAIKNPSIDITEMAEKIFDRLKVKEKK